MATILSCFQSISMNWNYSWNDYQKWRFSNNEIYNKLCAKNDIIGRRQSSSKLCENFFLFNWGKESFSFLINAIVLKWFFFKKNIKLTYIWIFTLLCFITKAYFKPVDIRRKITGEKKEKSDSYLYFTFTMPERMPESCWYFHYSHIGKQMKESYIL